MNKTNAARPVVVWGVLCTAVLVFVSFLRADENTTGDLAQDIEVFAAAGAVKSRGRNETRWVDLASGTRSMTSGTFLKTGNGPATILFANNTILCLDAGTEVQVGLYENGIWICQYSGRAFHSHEPGADNLHIVQTAFYAVRAIGTEYRTTLNAPVEGAVTIEWGKVGVIFPRETIGGIDGPVVPEVRAFVPSGRKIIAPIHEDVITTDPGTRIYRPDQSRKVIRGEKVVRQPGDEWERSRRDLARRILDLRRRRAAGRMTPMNYRRKLGSLLGIDPAIIPGRPSVPLGGLWIGSANNLVIKLCISGNLINDVHIVDFWSGEDKETHELSGIRVNFSLPQGAHFVIEPGGRVNGTYTIGDDDSIWKGATVDMWGTIGSGTGSLHVYVYSETDVALYQGSYETVGIRLADPNGCNY